MTLVKNVTDIEQHRIGFAVALMLKQDLVKEHGRFETSEGLLLPEGIWTEIMEIINIDHNTGENIEHSGRRIAELFDITKTRNGDYLGLFKKFNDKSLGETVLRIFNDEVFMLSIVNKTSGNIDDIDNMYECY